MKLPILFLIAITFANGLSANLYEHIPLKEIPKPEEIVAFTNGPRPADGTRKKLTKEDIQKYLAEGIVILEKSKWSYPTSFSNMNIMDGVFFDSAGVGYFWRIWEEGVLTLETEAGASVQIILKKKGA